MFLILRYKIFVNCTFCWWNLHCHSYYISIPNFKSMLLNFKKFLLNMLNAGHQVVHGLFFMFVLGTTVTVSFASSRKVSSFCTSLLVNILTLHYTWFYNPLKVPSCGQEPGWTTRMSLADYCIKFQVIVFNIHAD